MHIVDRKVEISSGLLTKMVENEKRTDFTEIERKILCSVTSQNKDFEIIYLNS